MENTVEMYNKFMGDREKKRKESWESYDTFVLEWCIEFPQQDFCYECSCLNNNPQSRSSGRPIGCDLHEDQALFWTRSRHTDVVPNISTWYRIGNKKAKKERKAREKHEKVVRMVKVCNDELNKLRLEKGICIYTEAELNGDFSLSKPCFCKGCDPAHPEYIYAEGTSVNELVQKDPFNINVVDVLTIYSDNSLSLLKVQGLISSMVPKWKTGSINDSIEMTCGLDTGATSSIMSYKTAMRYQITVDYSPLMFKGPDGVKQPVAGVTKTLSINVQGSLVEIQFVVIHHSDHDILLGLDWFQKTDCGFYPGKKILKFPKLPNYVILDRDEEDQNESIIDLCLADVPDELDLDNDISWEPNGTINIQPTAKLDPTQIRMFQRVAAKIKNIVATDLNNLGKCKDLTHVIRTISDVPIYTPPYRKNQKEREDINKQCEELYKAGIIRPSKSPSSSPVITVPKPDGSRRLCVDYRRLKANTVSQNFPMSRILDILDRLHGSKYFSSWDLKSGYYQILKDENSIAKTAFSTQDQHWEFIRCPFGLKNMPADFSRIMASILSDLPYIQIYLDDFLIHSDTFELHMSHIEEVVKRLEKYNLKLNLEKCTFCSEKVKILGHIVSYNTIEMDPAKTETIKNWREPKNVKNIQQFIGLASYYRPHILDFSKHAAPLYNLLKKDTPFVWDKSCEKKLLLQILKLFFVFYYTHGINACIAFK
jgi:hypothetical protein